MVGVVADLLAFTQRYVFCADRGDLEGKDNRNPAVKRAREIRRCAQVPNLPRQQRDRPARPVQALLCPVDSGADINPCKHTRNGIRCHPSQCKSSPSLHSPLEQVLLDCRWFVKDCRGQRPLLLAGAAGGLQIDVGGGAAAEVAAGREVILPAGRPVASRMKKGEMEHGAGMRVTLRPVA